MSPVLDALREAFPAWPQIVAAVMSLLGVWLAARNRIANWPIGIVGVGLTAWVVFEAKLYSDAIQNAFYVVSGFYGWWAWSKRPSGDVLPVTSLTNAARWAWIAGWVVVSLAWGFAMRRWTDAAFPFLDAALTAASFIAQILLTRRVIENWPIWIVVDVLYAAYVYPSRGLYIFAVMYGIFLVLAVMGLLEWNRLRRTEQATASLPTP